MPIHLAQALRLQQTAPYARAHHPHVAERQYGKQHAPQQRQGHAQEGRQQAVAPVLRDGEGGVAGLPNAVQAVGSVRLSDDVVKVQL